MHIFYSSLCSLVQAFSAFYSCLLQNSPKAQLNANLFLSLFFSSLLLGMSFSSTLISVITRWNTTYLVKLMSAYAYFVPTLSFFFFLWNGLRLSLHNSKLFIYCLQYLCFFLFFLKMVGSFDHYWFFTAKLIDFFGNLSFGILIFQNTFNPQTPITEMGPRVLNIWFDFVLGLLVLTKLHSHQILWFSDILMECLSADN